MSSQRIVDLRKGKPVRREAPSRPPQRESERRSPLRVRRRRTRFIWALVVVVLLAAVGYGVRVLSYQQQFSIQSISIEGAERMPPEIVREYVTELLDDGRFHFLSRRNVLRYPKSGIAHSIAANFPRVRSATLALRRPLSTELVVHIEERAPFSKWCGAVTEVASTCYWMDADGFIYAEAGEGERGENSYVFSSGIEQQGVSPIGSIFAPTHVPGLMAMLRYLEQEDFRPTTVSVENDQDFFVYLSEGFFVKASYGQDAAQLVRNLDLILASDALRGKDTHLEYIDLRFGNRVYYKLKGEAEVSAAG